jgi:hypothetical protein
MKTDKYQRRFYRDWVKVKGLYVTQITVKETRKMGSELFFTAEMGPGKNNSDPIL